MTGLVFAGAGGILFLNPGTLGTLKFGKLPKKASVIGFPVGDAGV